jgi:hypothetical protein
MSLVLLVFMDPQQELDDHYPKAEVYLSTDPVDLGGRRYGFCLDFRISGEEAVIQLLINLVA